MDRNESNFYSEYEIVTRKGKRKKSKKRFTLPDEQQSEAGDSIATDEGVTEFGSDVQPTTDDLSPEASVSTVIYPRDVISKDAALSEPPSYKENPEYEKGLEDAEEEFEEPVDHERELLLNTKALSKHAVTYELERFEKNSLIIFNLENIEGYEKREGSKKDVENLTETFERFGFEVKEHKDSPKEKIIEELDTFTENNLTDYGCLVVAILTHGTKNGLLRAQDQLFSENEIINKFKVINNLTLVTKPKVIIIQACRGTKVETGVQVHRAGLIRTDVDLNAEEPYMLPVEADMLILHSSYYGSVSHRHTTDGTWFIQELCKRINFLADTQDLESIMTEVKRDVAIDKYHDVYNRRTFQTDINKQMPVITSTLIRKLYLRKFGDGPLNLETQADRAGQSATAEFSNEMLDHNATPLLPQYGPCSCFLDHFKYMKDCLKHLIKDNPDDETAIHLWEIADTFEDGVEFNTSKEKASKAIAKHFSKYATNHDFYKFLYFYKVPL